MSQVVSLALFLPFIPHASEAVVHSDAILVVLSIDTELILVITPPLDNVPGQVWHHTEFDKRHIHALRNVDYVVTVSI